VKRREMEDVRPRELFVLDVRSLKGTAGAGAVSKYDDSWSGRG
jgi:hypothetical protein